MLRVPISPSCPRPTLQVGVFHLGVGGGLLQLGLLCQNRLRILLLQIPHQQRGASHLPGEEQDGDLESPQELGVKEEAEFPTQGSS